MTTSQLRRSADLWAGGCSTLEIACRRIEAAYAQPDMFVEAAKEKPKQEVLL